MGNEDQKKFLNHLLFRGSSTVGLEQSQASTRIGILLVVLTILAGVKLFDTEHAALGWDILGILSGYLVVSSAYYRFVTTHPDQHLWRRYVTIACDLGLTSYFYYRLGISGLSLYPFYLWVIVANGLRFGAHYLHFATVVGIVGFLIASIQSGVLGEQIAVVYGLLIGLIMMPKFFLVIVHRLSEVNIELTERSVKSEYAATHDALTELPNRAMFQDRFTRALKRAKREKSQVALVFIDLESFKEVNDNFGHDQGDLLLQQLGECLGKSVRGNDFVARLGGDEFVVLLENCGATAEISAAVEQIFKCSGRYYQLEHNQTYLTWSCGAAIYPQDGKDVDTLLKNADIAMYRAKEEGSNQFRLYSPDMTEKVARQMALRNELRSSIDKGLFETHFQPIVDADQGKIVGAEALARWNHPEYGLMLPEQFLKLAEHTGLILPIGEQAMREALETLQRIQLAGYKDLRIYLNISVRQLLNDEFIETVKTKLNDFDISPELIQFEVSEETLLESHKTGHSNLERLSALGIEFTLDNFGTGFSSLAHLDQHPVNQVKIDHSFIQQIPEDQNHCTLAKAALEINRRIGRATVAEGVANTGQINWLKAHGCNIQQGIYYAPSLTSSELLDVIRDKVID